MTRYNHEDHEEAIARRRCMSSSAAITSRLDVLCSRHAALDRLLKDG